MFNKDYSDVGFVILAAGKGKRLNCADIPKVMCKIAGQPLMSYILDTLESYGTPGQNINLVVGFRKEKVEEYFGKRNYVEQTELLGTAHAAYVGMLKFPPSIKTVFVLNGDDSMFYHYETIANLISVHRNKNAAITLLSVELDDPSQYGRIIRHPNGRIEIIEKEYLTDEQKKIKEVSAGTFCFNKEWFLKMFPTMPKMRKLGEYGLPTTFAVAQNDGVPVQVVKIKDNNEWFGVNTQDELKEADRKMKKAMKLEAKNI